MAKSKHIDPPRHAAPLQQGKPLLVHFRDSSRFGVTRDSLKEMADLMQRSETMTIHMALARMHQQLFPERYVYDAPLGEPTLAGPSEDGVNAFAKSLPGSGVRTIADFAA